MKSPAVYGNPVMFGPGDWNRAAGVPLKRGKSVEELGDADWARERERMAHLQHLQQLHQLQLQQQQVAYPAYGVLPPGPPQGPVLVASPVPPGHMPVPGGMMVPVGVPTLPPGHVQAPWPAQVGQADVFHQQAPRGHDVYYHPRSEDGHLDLRISEWKGKHCFYQGPEDEYNLQNNFPQERDSNDMRTHEVYGQMEDRGGRDDWDRENEYYSERYDHRRQRDSEEYNYRDRNRDRDHYDRKYKDQYEERGEKYYDTRKHRREDDRYNNQYEDHHDRKDKYAHRDNQWDRDYCEDRHRDYYDSKDRYRSREKDHYRHREEDRYYEEQKSRNGRSDRYAEDRYERRDHDYKHRDEYDRRGEEMQRSKRRAQYDSEVEERWEYRERDRNYRSRDSGDERYSKRREYKTREDNDDYDQKYEDQYESREEEHPHHRARDGFRNLRSVSVEPDYEEYPVKDRWTHCEKWVEQQNEKLARGEIQSFEDPIMYCHSDEQERGYESSAGNSGSKRSQKPVYVGSLDRNSFYRKTAPSSLRKSPFATTRRQKQGKHKDVVM